MSDIKQPDKPCVPIEMMIMGPIQNNVYLIGEDDALIVVDPTCEPEQILNQIGNRKVAAIILTHGHWDHVGAAKALRDVTGAPVIASSKDAPGIAGEEVSHSTGRFEVCPIDRRVNEGDEILIGDNTWQVIETPGHTPGSVCLYLDPAKSAHNEGIPVLISGDTLFQGTHGRTDFEGGSPAAMIESLKRLAQLPGETLVLPGHNNPTTIAAECQWIL